MMPCSPQTLVLKVGGWLLVGFPDSWRVTRLSCRGTIVWTLCVCNRTWADVREHVPLVTSIRGWYCGWVLAGIVTVLTIGTNRGPLLVRFVASIISSSWLPLLIVVRVPAA